MRVWYPGPCALNQARTSWSTRSDTRDLDGNGCRPCRTMPRTMCATLASGCSLDGRAFADVLCNRAQSVLDLTEVDLGFALRGFAEGDDADFIFGLRVDYRHRGASKQPERYDPLFTVR